MTCIVGISERGTVWMGADSAAVVDTVDVLLVGSKLIRRGPLLIGVSGSAKAANVFRHDVPPPKRRSRHSRRYMERDFGELVHRAFETMAALKTENGVSAWGGNALVGLRGELYLLDSTFGVTWIPDGYFAAGSGSPPALGALFATRGMPPAERIHLALEAAAAHAKTILAPFTMEVLES